MWYYIVIAIGIIITSVILSRGKTEWKYLSLLINIITLLSQPVYDSFIRDNPSPDIEAKIIIDDFINDTIFLKFEIRNSGNSNAYNVRHISNLGDNYYSESLIQIKVLKPDEERTIISFVKFNADIKHELLRPILYVYFEDKIKRNRPPNLYKRFDFIITSIHNTEKYPCIRSLGPVETENFTALLDSVLGVNEKFQRDNGFLMFLLKLEEDQSSFRIVSNENKNITYTSFDSNVNFIREYNDEILIHLKQKIVKEYRFDSHLISVNWSDTSSFLRVDGQNGVSDSLIKRGLKNEPAVVFKQFGIKLFQNNDFYNAINNLSKSIEFDSINEFITYEKLFLAYDTIGMKDRAIEVLRNAIRMGHTDSSIVVNLGLA